jgi:hypothetical protein
MSDSTATSAQGEYPESKMTLEEVTAALVETENRFVRLYKRFDDLSGGSSKDDKRTEFHPERNLKITVNAAYRHARSAGCNADEARNRAIAATINSASTYYPASLVNGNLPDSVAAYIDVQYAEYDLTDEEKKVARKIAKKNKNTKP